jgi:hypothetical protein
LEAHFIGLSRNLLISDAWRTLLVPSRNFIEYLMIEHMNQGGKRNGFLVAPYGQLVQFGISRKFIGVVILQTTANGQVDVARGTGRAANRYALTWLPLAGETVPTDRWRAYRRGGKPLRWETFLSGADK